MAAKINFKYIIILFIAVFLSCFFHEFAHWLTGEILGNKMTMSLNRVSSISGDYKSKWHENVITISAPIFTIIQAIAFYFIMNRNKSIYLYPFLFFPFVYRLSAGLANMLGPNDEGRFGMSFGLGLYTISILFCSFLFFLIYKTSLKNKFGLMFNLISFFMCVFALLFITFIDQYFKIKII